jgi:Cdc6-like AAA superfamily ATPase
MDSPNEPGVYLVTGNRGVGKTSLVSEVIKKTSLQPNSGFFKKLKSLFGFKHYGRLYLRINFGHKLKDEKDILRLIARTLSTKYAEYRHSFWRMLPWRTVAFGILTFLACLFSAICVKDDTKSTKGCAIDIVSEKNTIDSSLVSSHNINFHNVKSFLIVSKLDTIQSHVVFFRDSNLSKTSPFLLILGDHALLVFSKIQKLQKRVARRQ